MCMYRYTLRLGLDIQPRLHFLRISSLILVSINQWTDDHHRENVSTVPKLHVVTKLEANL